MFANSVEATKSGAEPWGKLMVVTCFRTGGAGGGVGVLEEPEPEEELDDEPEDELLGTMGVVGMTLGSNVETVLLPLLAT